MISFDDFLDGQNSPPRDEPQPAPPKIDNVIGMCQLAGFTARDYVDLAVAACDEVGLSRDDRDFVRMMLAQRVTP